MKDELLKQHERRREKERQIRSETIEECARVADSRSTSTLNGYETAVRIAAAIRALKGKTI